MNISEVNHHGTRVSKGNQQKKYPIMQMCFSVRSSTHVLDSAIDPALLVKYIYKPKMILQKFV